MLTAGVDHMELFSAATPWMEILRRTGRLGLVSGEELSIWNDSFSRGHSSFLSTRTLIGCLLYG